MAWTDPPDGGWGLIEPMSFQLRAAAPGWEASVTTGVIDSQSVEMTESGGTSGYEAGKKVKGRKRHIISTPADFWPSSSSMSQLFRTATAHPMF